MSPPPEPGPPPPTPAVLSSWVLPTLTPTPQLPLPALGQHSPPTLASGVPAAGAWSLPPASAGKAGASSWRPAVWCPLGELLWPPARNASFQCSLAQDARLQEQGCPTQLLSALSPQCLPTTTKALGLPGVQGVGGWGLKATPSSTHQAMPWPRAASPGRMGASSDLQKKSTLWASGGLQCKSYQLWLLERGGLRKQASWAPGASTACFSAPLLPPSGHLTYRLFAQIQLLSSPPSRVLLPLPQRSRRAEQQAAGKDEKPGRPSLLHFCVLQAPTAALPPNTHTGLSNSGKWRRELVLQILQPLLPASPEHLLCWHSLQCWGTKSSHVSLIPSPYFEPEPRDMFSVDCVVLASIAFFPKHLK